LLILSQSINKLNLLFWKFDYIWLDSLQKKLKLWNNFFSLCLELYIYFFLLISGLDYVAHEDVLPYTGTDKSPLHHDYCDYFLTYTADQSKFFTNLNRKEKGGWFMVFNDIIFSDKYFSYIVAVSFIDGGNWSTWRKPLTCRTSLTNISHNVVSSTPWTGFELKNPTTMWSWPRRPKRTKIQTMVDKRVHRKLKIEQHEPH
jgi:hypothetical protein